VIDNINAEPDYGDEPPAACSSRVFLGRDGFACGATPGHAGKHGYRLPWVTIEWDGRAERAAIATQGPNAVPEQAEALGDWPTILADVTQQRDDLRERAEAAEAAKRQARGDLAALENRLSQAIAAALMAERARIRELADRSGAVCTGDEGTSHYFSALLTEASDG
jgi:hypothetical protein